jgi:hypothetical protein
MKTKEKAKDLVERFDFIYTYDGLDIMDEELTNDSRKQCALIAVDEVINQCWNYREIDLGLALEYWQEVKQEIEKL